MHNTNKYLLLYFFGILGLLTTCQNSPEKEAADLIVHNAQVYRVNEAFDKAEAFAVKDGKFLAIGTSQEILDNYEAANTLDAEGRFISPGLYDAHCHFLGYGTFLQQADLVGTKSYEEILERLIAYREKYPDKTWIIGRGWDQNDWENKEFPTKLPLDSLFPDVPVYLTRVDGHAALVNQKVFDLAKLSPESKVAQGGLIEKKDGALTGILIDNAMGMVSRNIPDPTEEEKAQALIDAQNNCFAVGLTSVNDAGLAREDIELIDRLHKEGKLKMRIYAMVSNTRQNREYYLKKGPFKTDFLNVSAFKVYADGALGSRGACLIEPYSDSPEEIGFLRASPEELETWIKSIGEAGFQVNTHCIGDSANRFILDIYAKYLGGKNDKRWRIEHSQIIHPDDMNKFGDYNVIPSVQPTHCTSDMYWADERLGPERLKGAYAFQELYEQNQLIAFGSDFPVEGINPFWGFSSAVVRQDSEAYPEGGFQMENAVSREVALKAMTLWAAYSSKEENEKGSIEIGKFADFIILEDNLMEIEGNALRDIKVYQTYVNGELVYKSK